MINGVSSDPIIGTFRPECYIGDGQIPPNGGADPVAASLGGTLRGLYSVTRAGAGELLVTLDKRMKFPVVPTIVVTAVCADLAGNLFTAVQVGHYDNANHRFTIGTIAGGAAADVAADPNNWVNFAIFIQSSKAPR